MAIFIAAGGGTSVLAILAAVIRQTVAISANTTAIRTLTAKLDGIATEVGHHDTRIAVLEDRGPRRTRR